MNRNFDFIKDGLMGLIIGDIVGVPAEFKSRQMLKTLPVYDMLQYGTHFQPKGTWSDDSSMTLGTLDSLCDGYDPEDIMKKFVAFLYKNKYTPWGKVFDAGGATMDAVYKYRKGVPLKNCGGRALNSNGNGSLMRILPVIYYLYFTLDLSTEEGKKAFIHGVHEASALTHAHPISMIGCGIYAQLILQLIHCKVTGQEADKYLLAHQLQEGIQEAWTAYTEHGYGNLYDDSDYLDSLHCYDRLIDLTAFADLEEDDIQSSGYVVHTLEAALWCFLNTDNYRDCVLKAVNLGKDTDTVAAVAGSFAGICYGIEQMPEDWVEAVARKEWIEKLIAKFTKRFVM